jgi:hypothetical protein
LAINSTARVPSGFAPVDNVNSVKPGFPNDSLDGELSGSFLGQTLKYLFMVQEDPRSGSGASEKGWQVKVQGKQEYVFSSDGNIFRTPRIGKK